MSSGEDTISGTGALQLVLGVGVAVPVAFYLIWEAMPGNGCGPPGNTSAADVFSIAPFALPVLALVIVVIVGRLLKWRLWIVLTALLTTIALTVPGEVIVFFVQFGAHHCGE